MSLQCFYSATAKNSNWINSPVFHDWLLRIVLGLLTNLIVQMNWTYFLSISYYYLFTFLVLFEEKSCYWYACDRENFYTPSCFLKETISKYNEQNFFKPNGSKWQHPLVIDQIKWRLRVNPRTRESVQKLVERFHSRGLQCNMQFFLWKRRALT